MEKPIKIRQFIIALFYSITLLTPPLQANPTIYIVPPFGFEKNPESFLTVTNPNNLWGDVSIAFTLLIDALKQLDYSCALINPALPPPSLLESDRLMLLNFRHHLTPSKEADYAAMIKFISPYQPYQLILVALEPEVADMYNYFPFVHERCGTIFTCYDSLRGANFHKFYYPKASFSSTQKHRIPFTKRKLCVMIASNKKAVQTSPCELYSKRKDIVYFFEKHAAQDFDVYGLFWDKRYKVYKGKIPTFQHSTPKQGPLSQAESDKLTTLQNYRFCICFENMRGIKESQGYISEKILDCLKAGCVPIYWGAKNIDAYIPSNCFIKYEKFTSIKALYAFLRKMPEKTFNAYLDNIKRYLASDKAQIFTVTNFVDTILSNIIADYDRTKVFTQKECSTLERLDTIKKQLIH